MTTQSQAAAHSPIHFDQITSNPAMAHPPLPSVLVRMLGQMSKFVSAYHIKRPEGQLGQCSFCTSACSKKAQWLPETTRTAQCDLLESYVCFLAASPGSGLRAHESSNSKGGEREREHSGNWVHPNDHLPKQQHFVDDGGLLG